MKYTVKYFRSQGLTVRWAKTRSGAPIIVAKTDCGSWVYIDNKMWERAKVVGIKQAFEENTAFIQFFSVAA